MTNLMNLENLIDLFKASIHENFGGIWGYRYNISIFCKQKRGFSVKIVDESKLVSKIPGPLRPVDRTDSVPSAAGSASPVDKIAD